MNRELVKIDFSPNALIERKIVAHLLEINSTTQKHGLILTEAIAKEIAEARQYALKENDRIDFSSDTLTRLVKAFSESYYITQENFSEIIGEMLDLFYFLKNEIDDVLSDDDMISEMLIVFNETCFGAMEAMYGRGVEKIIRKYSFGDRKIWDGYENPDRFSFGVKEAWHEFGVDDVWHDYEKLEDKWEYGETWRE